MRMMLTQSESHGTSETPGGTRHYHIPIECGAAGGGGGCQWHDPTIDIRCHTPCCETTVTDGVRRCK